ncbi:hypothetical protein DPX16_22440 [Anabarilius grahami]|uniref:Uncharacterized protein n=1 Tax=Anabarilius grahami TaxID=495550 RepID=A0A3N0YZQ3_ANAGA|nr:hypothetical protein DPX16_22440 [Anabarilius grahami]
MILDLILVFIFPRDRGSRQAWNRRDTMTLTDNEETLGITWTTGYRQYMCHGCQLRMGEEISKVLKADNLTPRVRSPTDSEKEFRDGPGPNE